MNPENVQTKQNLSPQVKFINSGQKFANFLRKIVLFSPKGGRSIGQKQGAAHSVLQQPHGSLLQPEYCRHLGHLNEKVSQTIGLV